MSSNDPTRTSPSPPEGEPNYLAPMTATMIPPPRPLTVLIFVGILFGIIFVNEINEINRINENENVEIEFEFEFELRFEKMLIVIFMIMVIYDNGPYPTPAPSPTPATVFYFNGIDNGLAGIDILECIFGVGLCENNIVNDMDNGINNNGM